MSASNGSDAEDLARAQRLSAAWNERLRELFDGFSYNNDLTALVLKGHLAVEELLFTTLSSNCSFPEHLPDARLRFPQVVALLRALQSGDWFPVAVWSAALHLNSLRNALAHQIQPKDLEAKVERFVAAVSEGMPQLEIEKPYGSEKALRRALGGLFGILGVMAFFQADLDRMLLLRSSITERDDIDALFARAVRTCSLP